MKTPACALALFACVSLATGCIKNEPLAMLDGGSDVMTTPDTVSPPPDTVVTPDVTPPPPDGSVVMCGGPYHSNTSPGACTAVDYGIEGACACIIGVGWNGTRCAPLSGCRATRNTDRIYADEASCQRAYAACLGTADGGAGCGTSADCPSGQQCIYSSPGCGVRGACTAAVCPPSAPFFCGCDGRTFMARSACAEQPWVSMGPCPAADGGTDGGGGGVCRTSADCPSTQRCAYEPGSCAVGVTGRCIDRGCESLPVAPQYCGCDGVTTIQETSACPPDQPYARNGACAGRDGG